MKRKLVAAIIAASLVVPLVPMEAHAIVKRIHYKHKHKIAFHGHGNAGAWIVGSIVCAASGPILTTLILNRELTRNEAIGSMFFCFPPGLYGLMLKNQGTTPVF